MNNPNPFVPKGSLLEKQSHRRSQLKIGVSCVLALSIAGLVVMLIQGCKREQPKDDSLAGMDTNSPVPVDATMPSADTNLASMPPLAPPTNTPPVMVPPPVIEPVAPVSTPGSEYVVVKGDTLTTIAKKNHVTLKDLAAANPGVDSKHLKLKQKLVIPAGSAPSANAPTATGMADASGDTYTVKSGDTLTTIAKKHGTNVKALMAANNLTTTKIKVNQKLKLPARAEVAPAPAPMDTTPAPAMLTPAPSPAPGPTPMK